MDINKFHPWWNGGLPMVQNVAASVSASTSINLTSVPVWDNINNAWVFTNVGVGDEILSVVPDGAAGPDLKYATTIVSTNVIQISVSTTGIPRLVVTTLPGELTPD